MVDREVPRPLRVRLEEIRFLTFGRAIPAALFALLGWRVLNNVVSQVHALPLHPSALDIAGGPLPTALYCAFCCIPVGIYLVRPRPQARDGRLVARAAAFAGTTMLLVVGAFPNPVLATLPEAVRGIATPLTLGAFSLALFG